MRERSDGKVNEEEEEEEEEEREEMKGCSVGLS
jgi:hypothetical protein